MQRRVITTNDGSHTLEVIGGPETFHSCHGAIQGSQYAFLDSGLKVNTHRTQPLQELDVGYGTGLNAWLTLLDARSSQRFIAHTSLEPYHIDEIDLDILNYPKATGAEKVDFAEMHRTPWGVPVMIKHFFELLKVNRGLLDFCCGEGSFDGVYYDAFGPASQPKLWTPECLAHCWPVMNESVVSVTYCAKGQVRYDLDAVGFYVERLPCPVGKREMLGAWKRMH